MAWVSITKIHAHMRYYVFAHEVVTHNRMQFTHTVSLEYNQLTHQRKPYKQNPWYGDTSPYLHTLTCILVSFIPIHGKISSKWILRVSWFHLFLIISFKKLFHLWTAGPLVMVVLPYTVYKKGTKSKILLIINVLFNWNQERLTPCTLHVPIRAPCTHTYKGKIRHIYWWW